ncbi:Peroxisome biosynthesis protein pex1 [Serendipita sp. 411]|nr:Peroxisome biosynthesis protein pex1 [Serendipita sp. 411]
MRRVRLKYSSQHSSLVNLPLSVYGPLVSAGVRPQAIGIHISNGKKGQESKVAYLGWTGLASASSAARWTSNSAGNDLDTLEIDPQLASSLGFSEEEVVELALLHNLPIAKSISTEPLSPDDWEILELHAQYVEENLLSQVRVAADGQQINVWVMGKTLIRFRVLSIDPPSGPCLLSTATELVIAPKLRRSQYKPNEPVESQSITLVQVARVLPQFFPTPSSMSMSSATPIVVASSILQTMGLKEGQEVYIEHMAAPVMGLLKDIKHIRDPSIKPDVKELSLKNLRETGTKPQLDSTGQELQPNLIVVEQPSLPADHIQLPQDVGIQAWSLVRLSSKPFDQNKDRPSSTSAPINPFFLTTRMRQVRLVAVKPFLLESIQHFSYSFLSQADSTLHARGSQLLLCGNRGSGKTSLAISVAHALEKEPGLYLCPLFVDLSRFTEESLTGIKSLFTLLVRLSLWHQPTFLVLDNLHHLVGVETEHTESFRSTQIAELFKSLLQVLSRHPVGVLAVAEGISSLHKAISTGHSFSKIVTIKPPDKSVRAEILEHVVNGLTSQPHSHELNYMAIATRTEGYSARDLEDLVNRAMHQATMRSTNERSDSVILRMIDLERAQDGFTPLSVRNIKLHKSEVEWADIGGLHETRRILRETLEWPTKYAAIFANCPLRLRSGLLLYGYPGCGKTLLASAVSQECGLNFIGVKGPELLNKYIGASEKSVRELFERASAAKPCVLFFDEFDSIAPRRGHDSTGVTDRVVNQMLTQMDGAEGLDGVYVLAATSRPDLIDPALLRPGRLDKSLLCHMPTESERLEILSAIARKMEIHPSVDFARVASETDGYSGADLQALVYNAHLESVHFTLSHQSTPSVQKEEALPEFVVLGQQGQHAPSRSEQSAIATRIATILSKSNPKRATQTTQASQKPMITAHHLNLALRTTRPSVPDQERQRLERIYRDFSSDRSNALPNPPGFDTHAIGNRASLM